MEKYFDKENRRLVFVKEKATPDFWDRQWQDAELKKYVLNGKNDRFVYPTTKKYLSPGAKILEGGCGKGQFVYSLQSRGYDAYGLDFAKNIITTLQEIFPESNFDYGDVRDLPYEDNFFDGYWSLGVIEHFPEGYASILKEMARVVKPGGYTFVTFPHMSRFRKIKASLRKYPSLSKKSNWQENFYQFALSEAVVIEDLKKYGFQKVQTTPLEGLKGMKDELSGISASLLQKLYSSDAFIAKVIKHFVAKILAPFSSHSVLIILKKS